MSLATSIRQYSKEISREYMQLIRRCEEKRRREEAKMKRIIEREQQIRFMKHYLEEEASTTSDSVEEPQNYERLAKKIVAVQQNCRTDRQYVLHDEIGIEKGQQQAIWLDVDLHMTNTWDRYGKRIWIALFEIIYVFNSDKLSRSLRELDTDTEVARETE